MNKSNNTNTATKSDVKELKGEIALVRLDMKDIEQRLDDKNRKYKDEILTGLDGVMKELQTMREENTAGAHQIRELRERTDNHETRITKLESPAT